MEPIPLFDISPIDSVFLFQGKPFANQLFANISLAWLKNSFLKRAS